MISRSILFVLIGIFLPLSLIIGQLKIFVIFLHQCFLFEEILTRYTIISLIYGLFLLIYPFLIPIGNKKSFRLYFLLLISLSFLSFFAQLVFQLIIFIDKTSGETLPQCQQRTKFLRYFGFEK